MPRRLGIFFITVNLYIISVFLSLHTLCKMTSCQIWFDGKSEKYSSLSMEIKSVIIHIAFQSSVYFPTWNVCFIEHRINFDPFIHTEILWIHHHCKAITFHNRVSGWWMNWSIKETIDVSFFLREYLWYNG